MQSLAIRWGFSPNASNCACGFDQLREHVKSFDFLSQLLATGSISNTLDFLVVAGISVSLGDLDI